jgi:hypothetical protein
MTRFASLRSALANNRRAVIASTAAAAIVAGVMGTAGAIAPTLETGRTLHGGVDLRPPGGQGNHLVYTVPSDKAFTLTDIIATNAGTSTTGLGLFRVYIAPTSACGAPSGEKMSYIGTQPNETLVINFVTGITFGPGQFICVNVPSNGNPSFFFTMRGYTWTN